MSSNGNGHNGRYTAQQFIEAIPGTGGVVSTIARAVGCEWHTARKYIDKFLTVHQAWTSERNRITDIAKSNIIAAIESKDLQMSKWWLSMMDEEFKPTQRTELTGADGGPIILQWPEDDGDNAA